MEKLKIEKEYYVIIKKEGIKGDGKNAHIFKYKSSGVSKPSSNMINSKSECGEERTLTAAVHIIDSEYALSDKDARTNAAHLQNKDINICGNCVSTLYADESPSI